LGWHRQSTNHIRILVSTIRTLCLHLQQWKKKGDFLAEKIIIDIDEVKRVNISKEVYLKCSNVHGYIFMHETFCILSSVLIPLKSIDLGCGRVKSPVDINSRSQYVNTFFRLEILFYLYQRILAWKNFSLF